MALIKCRECNGTVSSSASACPTCGCKRPAVIEIGRTYPGTVSRILEFGAFVDIGFWKDALLHISDIANRRVTSVGDELHEGQQVRVKVIDVHPNKGDIRVSLKDASVDHSRGSVST